VVFMADIDFSYCDIKPSQIWQYFVPIMSQEKNILGGKNKIMYVYHSFSKKQGKKIKYNIITEVS